MRLTHIKLAGFKSFVDPITISVPSQLVGVVGPNGCGKSNIMDAVRWVLGESKASELRGDSMQDVIFNGSKERKPAGRASVELAFDNADGRFLGQWQSYAEVRVKRVLGRDGLSQYFINQQQVRRKDIYELFLGTGLGSKGYAMIGQGMINRLLEAKPEELRVYLEEAAGVSRYKQKRKETQRRLEDTRDNLTRVEDIIQELDQQLVRLERQAEHAKQYRYLQEQGLQVQSLLWFVQEQNSQDKKQRKQDALKSLNQQLQGLEDQMSQLSIEHGQQVQVVDGANEHLHRVQQQLYQSNVLITRLQTQQQHTIEMIDRLRLQIHQLNEKQTQWHEQETYVDEQMEVFAEQMMLAQAQQEELNMALYPLEDEVVEKEAILKQNRLSLKELSQNVASIQQALLLNSHEKQSLIQRQKQLDTELKDQQNRCHQLVSPPIERLEDVRHAYEVQLQKVEDLNILMQEMGTKGSSLEKMLQVLQSDVLEQRVKIQRIEAQYQTLSSLQIQAQEENQLGSWLDAQGLSHLKPAWEYIHIESGWEKALEAVMGERLQSLEVSALDYMMAFESTDIPSSVCFYTDTVGQPMMADERLSDFPTLLSKVDVPDGRLKSFLKVCLQGVYCVEDLSQALTARELLSGTTCFVSLSGHRVDRSSLSFYMPNSLQSGQLARRESMQVLSVQQEEAEQVLDDMNAKLISLQSQLATHQQSLKDTQQLHQQASQESHALALELQKLEQQVVQTQKDQLALASSITRIETSQKEIVTQLECLECRFSAMDEQLAEAQTIYSDKEIALEDEANVLDEYKAKMQNLVQQIQSTTMQLNHWQSQSDQLSQQKELAKMQSAQVIAELNMLQSELKTAQTSQLSDDLHVALEEQAGYQLSVEDARKQVEIQQTKLQTISEEKMGVEQQKLPLLETQMQLQLDIQAAQLNFEQYQEQLNALEVDRALLGVQLQALVADQRTVTHLQAEVKNIQRKINALGNVNLAAIEELEETSERATFLKSQRDDLLEAMAALEEAIRKIDRQTKSLLQDTFDQVNQHFSVLFPQLFGGGQAELMMTGDDILEAGVQVMAQPPGKKNSSISLLSGGEKALTAIALVFSLFKLNPAPFCLLDEVDAPLDDANTDRFARMVECMTDQTQFLFISHNKIAMQMAHHLIGVTMQEQGVSRIVSVDMQEALAMANT